MTINIGGTGVGLNYPSTLYPASISNVPYEAGTNYASLAASERVIIPPGWWWLDAEPNVLLQYIDPVTGVWRGNNNSSRLSPRRIWSDGANFSLFNPTGTPVAGIVTAQGSGYVQSTTTVTANGSGGSTWEPIIGGAISTSVTVVSGGSNYSIAPQVYFAAPPSPGIQAQGYATISAGAVTGVTVTNVGAGYTTAPTPVFIPNPADPNLATITAATATTTISGNAGKLCGVICTNPGAAVSTVPTLTVAGAGSSATVTAVALCTITAATASGGANYTTSNAVTSVGGQSSAAEVAATANPSLTLSGFIPRAAYGTATVSAGALTGFTFYDTGLFASSNFSSNQPLLVVTNNTGASAASGALTLGVTLGGAPAGFSLQPV